MGRSCLFGAVQSLGLVYRHAENSFSNGYLHRTEHRKHPRQPDARLWFRHEDRGCGLGYSHRTICRFHRGFGAAREVLRKNISWREECGGRSEKCLPQSILPPRILPDQPRHLPTDALLGGSESLFHFSRSPPRSYHSFRQYRPHATLSFLLLLYGWFCIRRRGIGR